MNKKLFITKQDRKRPKRFIEIKRNNPIFCNISAEKPYFGYYIYFPDSIIGSGGRSFQDYKQTNKQTKKETSEFTTDL